jgi:hypothetical protein
MIAYSMRHTALCLQEVGPVPAVLQRVHYAGRRFSTQTPRQLGHGRLTVANTYVYVLEV